MALGESAGLKAVLYYLPSFIGATTALFLDPPKQKWAIPILLIVFCGMGEIAGPILQSTVDALEPHAAGSRMVGAALGWTVLKAAQRIIRQFNPSKKVVE